MEISPIDLTIEREWLKSNPDVDPNELESLRHKRDELSRGAVICDRLIRQLENNMNESDVLLSRKIVDLTSITQRTRERLALVLSLASYGKIKAEDVTIRDLLESSHDLSDIPALNRLGNNYQPMFSEKVVRILKETLKNDYGVDYEAERARVLSEHTGLNEFILDLDITKEARNSMIRYFKDHNATLSDLLMAKKGLREFSSVGPEIEEHLLDRFRGLGIDYRKFRASH